MSGFVFQFIARPQYILSHRTVQSKGRENEVIMKLQNQSLTGKVFFNVSVYCFFMKITGYLDFQESWNPPPRSAHFTCFLLIS